VEMGKPKTSIGKFMPCKVMGPHQKKGKTRNATFGIYENP